MKKMARISLLLLSIALGALVVMPLIKPAQAYIQSEIWMPPYAYKGYESTYYNQDIVAYVNGSTVAVKIPVSNTYSSYINVTAVSMVFDWGLNKTVDYGTLGLKINYGETRYFDISFTANIKDATNVWAHDWTIYVRYVESGNYHYTWTSTPGYHFVVFSQDQKDSRDLAQEYSAYESSFPTYNMHIQARLLATQAAVARNLGNNMMNVGNYTAAKTNYQTAVSKYKEAIDNENTRGTAVEDAQLNATITDANAAMKQADAAMNQAQATMSQAYGYILLGLGVIFLGIGAILYGMKKPKQ